MLIIFQCAEEDEYFELITVATATITFHHHFGCCTVQRGNEIS